MCIMEVKPDGSSNQEQEQNSPKLGPTFQPSPVQNIAQKRRRFDSFLVLVVDHGRRGHGRPVEAVDGATALCIELAAAVRGWKGFRIQGTSARSQRLMLNLSRGISSASQFSINMPSSRLSLHG